MVDNTPTHVRKVGGKARKNCNKKSQTILFCFSGVRFTVDATDSSNKPEENPLKTSIHFFYYYFFSISFY